MSNSEPALKEERVVFDCGALSYTVDDVIDAAHFRGELDPFWKQLLVRTAAEELASNNGAELDEAEMDAEAIAFRYRYDLITAEETEAWLEARGLTLADFSAHFARDLWGKKFGGGIKPETQDFTDASAEDRDLLMTDLIMSGEFDRMATRLAWRVAAAAAGNDENEAALEAARMNFRQRSGLSAAEIPHWLGGLERDQSWLDKMIALEAAYDARCAQGLTPEARQRELGSLRLPLTRFEVEIVELESHDAAKEAFMCVRDDGMTMEEVAEEGRYPFHKTKMLLEEISDDLQQKFLSLTPGSLLEPAARDDGFVLTRIIAKKEPTLNDPDVRARVEEAILRRHYADIASGRIRWALVSSSADE